MTIEAKPIIVIDSREQAPLVFRNLPSITAGLVTGDYSIQGLEDLFSIERKSLDDITACCSGENRQRFERELCRLRGMDFARLLIVGSMADILAHRYISKIPPASVLGSLAAWEIRYDVPVVWADTPETAALNVERWAMYYAREVLKRATSITQANADTLDV